jgi:hypothetical protein
VGERPKKKKIIFSPPPSLPHSGSVDDAGERVEVEKEGLQLFVKLIYTKVI